MTDTTQPAVNAVEQAIVELVQTIKEGMDSARMVNIPDGYPDQDSILATAADFCSSAAEGSTGGIVKIGVCPHTEMILDTAEKIFGIPRQELLTEGFCGLVTHYFYPGDRPYDDPNPACGRLLKALRRLHGYLEPAIRPESIQVHKGRIRIAPRALTLASSDPAQIMALAETLKRFQFRRAFLRHWREQFPQLPFPRLRKLIKQRIAELKDLVSTWPSPLSSDENRCPLMPKRRGHDGTYRH